jgi:hypothetical protein
MPCYRPLLLQICRTTVLGLQRASHARSKPQMQRMLFPINSPRCVTTMDTLERAVVECCRAKQRTHQSFCYRHKNGMKSGKRGCNGVRVKYNDMGSPLFVVTCFLSYATPHTCAASYMDLCVILAQCVRFTNDEVSSTLNSTRLSLSMCIILEQNER